MAEQLIETLSADFEPEKYEDGYRNRVLELIDRKANGEEIVVAAAGPAPAQVVDLMAALEASVSAAKEARSRHPAGNDELSAKAKTRSTRAVVDKPIKKANASTKRAAKKTAPKKTAAKKTAAKKLAAKKAS